MVVMGGTYIGQTTDATAALLAEYANADLLLILTNVDGIYNKDPNKHPDAKRYDQISTKTLIDLFCKKKMIAGPNIAIDLMAIKVIERANLTTYVLDGNNLKNIQKILNGEHIGTKIIP
jgi:uridylate kinase